MCRVVDTLSNAPRLKPGNSGEWLLKAGAEGQAIIDEYKLGIPQIAGAPRPDSRLRNAISLGYGMRRQPPDSKASRCPPDTPQACQRMGFLADPPQFSCGQRWSVSAGHVKKPNLCMRPVEHMNCLGGRLQQDLAALFREIGFGFR